MSIYYFPTRARTRVIFLLAVLIVVGIAAVFTWNRVMSQGDFTQEALHIIAVCEDESYRPSCYDNEIPKVMDRGFSLEDSFKVTAEIQKLDESYWYCHVLGHNVSAKEAAKDVSQWTEVVARCPQGVCSNGCLHGAFQERFRGEYVDDEELEALIPEIRTICEYDDDNRNFTGLEQASCYHALGHLTMYITNADIDRAVDVCDRVSIHGERDFSRLCYDGAYMQIFQPLEPEDIALVQDIAPETKQEAVMYCSQFSGPRRTSCLMESWPLFVDDFVTTHGAIEAFCSRDFDHHDRTRCLNGVFYVLAARSNFDEKEVSRICSYVSDATKAQCYANSASRFLETDYKLAQKAVAVCEEARAAGVGDACYDELLFYSSYNYHAGSEAFVTLCSELPEPWAGKCHNNEGANMPVPFFETGT